MESKNRSSPAIRVAGRGGVFFAALPAGLETLGVGFETGLVSSTVVLGVGVLGLTASGEAPVSSVISILGRLAPGSFGV
jgi:hypothetical protein